MKRRQFIWMLTWGISVFHFNCAERVPPAGVADQAPRTAATNGATTGALLSEHMTAEAMLTAHYIAAALKARMSAEEINGALASVANGSAISEFWVSDENGTVVYTNIPEAEFAFPTDPEADSQAAPLAVLLFGDQAIVDQDFMPRAQHGMVFKYVAAAGVDQARIVQVGVAAPPDSDSP